MSGTTEPVVPQQLRAALEQCPLLPVVVVGEHTDGAALGAALVAGGLTAAEVVLRTPSAVRVLAAMVATDGLVVGAGTVVEPDQVDDIHFAGAAFVVSPGYDAEVLDRAAALGLPAVPGVATATEVQRARRAGYRLLKVFPAGAAGGTALLSGLAGPFPDLRFVPTGGIGQADLGDYLALPSVAGVGGSWCVPGGLVADVTGPDTAAGAELTARVAAAVTAGRAARP